MSTHKKEFGKGKGLERKTKYGSWEYEVNEEIKKQLDGRIRLEREWMGEEER